MYTISVTKFNNIVRDIFNNEELLHSVNVVGEVFGVSRAKNALYFSVKDEESTLPCVSFNEDIFSSIREGEQVVLYGGPNFYTKMGRFNYIVYKVEPVGQGLLYQKFIELKNKLEQEGLFDQAHKKQLPLSIKRIGVVTSREGAVIQDIKNVTWRRNPTVDIVLYSTKVQGNDAEKEIVEGINFFSNYDNVDVVVVARGGGSMEDLAAYNTESVARATYNCKKPIVSAVGHETDFTIIDFVSDLRAPTPSAAAELLTKDREKERSTFTLILNKLCRELNTYISDKTELFNDTISALTDTIEDYLTRKSDRLYVCCDNLLLDIDNIVKNYQHTLELRINALKWLDPRAVLKRGYTLIEQEGKLKDTLSSVDLNKNIEVSFADGKLTAKPIK